MFYDYFTMQTLCLKQKYKPYFSLTFFYGSIISCYQTDLKKILAYSTISNCGLMFISLMFSNKKNNFI